LMGEAIAHAHGTICALLNGQHPAD